MAGKEKERENMGNRIINYCKKHNVLGNRNYKCGNYLVSFEIKDAISEVSAP